MCRVTPTDQENGHDSWHWAKVRPVSEPGLPGGDLAGEPPSSSSSFSLSPLSIKPRVRFFGLRFLLPPSFLPSLTSFSPLPLPLLLLWRFLFSGPIPSAGQRKREREREKKVEEGSGSGGELSIGLHPPTHTLATAKEGD